MYHTNSANMLSLRMMRYHQFVWQLTGLWPPDTTGGKNVWFARVYPLYRLLIFGIFYTLFPACMLLNLLFVPNLGAVVNTLLVSSTVVLAAVKGVLIWLNRAGIRQLLVAIGELDACLVNAQQRALIQLALRDARRIVIMLSILYYGGCVFGFALTQLDRPDGVEPLLMWPSWYPGVPWQRGGAVLAAVLAFQMLGSCAAVLMDSSADVYGAAVFVLLGAHFDALGLRLDALGHEQYGAEPDDHRQQLHFERELRACIRHHQLCVRVAERINAITSVHYLIQFGCSGLIVCASAFQLSVMNPVKELSRFTFVCEYLMAMSIQIYVPCYYGSALTVKSERLLRNLYASCWQQQSRRFCRALLVLAERMLRSMVPMAGGLMVIGLPTFVSVSVGL